MNVNMMRECVEEDLRDQMKIEIGMGCFPVVHYVIFGYSQMPRSKTAY